MFGFQREPGLQQSWLTGAVTIAALLRPVLDARTVCAWTEPEVRALRDSLESVFEQWRNENGVLPDENIGGLLGNVYAGKSLDECAPYACMGKRSADYADLLAKLTAEQYQPLMELEAEADNLCNPPSTLPAHIPRLPTAATKPGMQRILAALILSEAAAGVVESATKAHWELSLIQRQNELRMNESMRAGEKVIHALALSAHKSHQGYKRRDDYQDKRDCQEAAKALWKKNPTLTIAALKRTPDIARYVRKYPGKNTVWGWLSEIDPRPPEQKRGRKKTG